MTINLEFPGACEVTQEHQNEIIISVIFKLKEGSQSTDEENRVILKTYPSDIFCDDIKQ